MVRRRRNPKALNLINQRGALEAESGCCSSRPPELPIRTPAGSENFPAHFIFKRRIRDFRL